MDYDYKQQYIYIYIYKYVQNIGEQSDERKLQIKWLSCNDILKL